MGFVAAEGCSRDVLGVTQKVRWRYHLEQRDVPFFLNVYRDVQLQIRTG
jgi:hypothetical protein